jgi:CO dehydrogenase/acetyl-CoA synthase delta subunit
MAFEMPTLTYTGKIHEIKLGKEGQAVTVGGETAYSFYTFEGTIPNPPKVAIQVLDHEPDNWAPAAVEPWKDVINDPVAWALKAQDEYKADMISLWLLSTDPNGMNRSAEEASEITKKVADAISVPLIVWGTSSDEKNIEVLCKVAEDCSGYNLILGPVTESSYKQIGARAIANQHKVVATTPLDINLAKQLNILLINLGVPESSIIIDPNIGGLGYGMEYAYSVIERIRQAGLTQQDDKLQFPVIAVMAEEVWKVKEAKVSEEEEPKLGSPKERAVMMEVITAVSFILAGADMLVLRHPDTLKEVRDLVSELLE